MLLTFNFVCGRRSEVREVTFPADQWDIEENRRLHLDQFEKEGWEVVSVQPVANRHEYVVTLKPKAK